MSSNNKSFLDNLASAVEVKTPAPDRPAERNSRLGKGVLGNRANRLSDLASGAVVNNPQELVDPARCRIWEHHNRDYTALTYERCADVIEPMIAQGKQEFPAIVRRVADDPDYDFEVISGARRHWSVTWLRAHNYPEFRYLVEIRSLTDEQAFRLSDIENRAREDLSDLERARDYLKALDLYYDGSQKEMARRINQSESWLSRYLDLARFHPDLIAAFPDPFELKISHVGQLKPLLKGDGSRAAVMDEARRLKEAREAGEEGQPGTVPDVLRSLTAAAGRDAEKAKPTPPKPVAPKKSGMDDFTVRNGSGAALFRVEGKDRKGKGLSLTLFLKGGGTREETEAALRELLDHHWPKGS